MRVRTTTEHNLIKIHFGMQEVNDLSVKQETVDEVQETSNCENGICALNWSPVRPQKKDEAA